MGVCLYLLQGLWGLVCPTRFSRLPRQVITTESTVLSANHTNLGGKDMGYPTPSIHKPLQIACSCKYCKLTFHAEHDLSQKLNQFDLGKQLILKSGVSNIISKGKKGEFSDSLLSIYASNKLPRRYLSTNRDDSRGNANL